MDCSGPTQFPEAFKDYELASKIGELMQRRTFSDMAEWCRGGGAAPTVAINAAPAEFLRNDFAEKLISRMTRFGIDPHLVEIEVTEHVFFDQNLDFVSQALKQLKQIGAKIALDDFGTGYSSLSHLRDFPVDVVKIDQSFIRTIVVDPEIAAIVSAVIDLGSNLGLTVVAEGVETSEQRNLLVQKGC